MIYVSFRRMCFFFYHFLVCLLTRVWENEEWTVNKCSAKTNGFQNYALNQCSTHALMANWPNVKIFLDREVCVCCGFWLLLLFLLFFSYILFVCWFRTPAVVYNFSSLCLIIIVHQNPDLLLKHKEKYVEKKAFF